MSFISFKDPSSYKLASGFNFNQNYNRMTDTQIVHMLVTTSCFTTYNAVKNSLITILMCPGKKAL